MTSPVCSYKHPVYGDWLLDVQRPARYVGCELGAEVDASARIQIALAFPDLYDIGMSHLGLRILYQVVNAQPDMAAERVFMPWPDMEEQLRSRNLPLVSLECARPLSDFAVVGFSLQYELTYTNLLAMLDLGGIPIHSAERTESHPIVLAGGPVATHAEPIAPFVDLFVIGEAEEALVEILRIEDQARQGGKSRQERIRTLDELPYCYAPALHPVERDPVSGRLVVQSDDPVARRAWIENLADWPSSATGPVPAIEPVFDRISLEIMRGCTQGCRFCQAGVIYRPVRELDASQVVEALRHALDATGWDEASLTGLSPADHSHLLEVFHQAAGYAKSQDLSLSVSSLRAYGLPDQFLDDLRTGRGGGLTFAPEAGTQRMRDLVNKNVSTEDLLATAEAVSKRGWNRIKLYFMLGLPTETDEDLEAIVALGWDVRKAAKRSAPKRAPTVTCSLSTFVPKPHTPFQWEPMITLEEIRRRQSVVKKAAAGSPVRLRFHEPVTSILEGVLCRGDRALAPIIEKAYRAGCRFDGWEEYLRWDLWETVFEEEGVDPGSYLAALPQDGRLPWDHIDVGVRRAFLLRELRHALNSHATKPCGQPDPENPSKIVCHGCGAPCDLEAIAHRYETDHIAPQSPPTEQDADTRPTVRVRLRYSKTDRAVLWGHLALVRHIPRTLRRAGLRPAYSEGFHPKPKIAYAPPLPVGWAGLAELADLVLVESEDTNPDRKQGLIEHLNLAAPPGLRILDLRRLSESEPPLGRVIEAERYDVLVLGKTETELSSRLDAFERAGKLCVEKTSKSGKIRTIDLKKTVTALSVASQQATSSPHGVTLSMTIVSGIGVSALMAVQEIFGAGRAIVTRTGFIGRHGSDPFDGPSGK